jgi:molybdopterin molybdotransferase
LGTCLARLRGFQKLSPVNEALQKFLGDVKFSGPKTVSVPLGKGLNRVLAETVMAKEDLPRVDRSAVDGYAVKAQDIFDASQFKPITLGLTQRGILVSKRAKKLWTGDSIPKGANAVAMLENTKEVDDSIQIGTPLTPGENVSKKGEDIMKGEVAAQAGTRLRPQHLGLLAALGICKVKVFRKPKIAIFSTGNEIADVGSRRQKIQIFDSNRPVISALCEEIGARPIDLGIAKNDLGIIIEKLRESLTADATISTGGTSVGGLDLVPEAVNDLGSPGIIVHGIAMRPGMPTALAVVHNKPIMIFPGNPVAAMVAFEVFARPLIQRMLGLKRLEKRPTLEARMTRRITTPLGRRTFVRVRVLRQNGELFAEPISVKGSSLISTMTKSNGYTVVPEYREGLEKGETVVVHLFEAQEET